MKNGRCSLPSCSHFSFFHTGLFSGEKSVREGRIYGRAGTEQLVGYRPNSTVNSSYMDIAISCKESPSPCCCHAAVNLNLLWL